MKSDYIIVVHFNPRHEQSVDEIREKFIDVLADHAKEFLVSTAALVRSDNS